MKHAPSEMSAWWAGQRAEMVSEVTRAVKARVKLPVIVKLTRAIEELAITAAHWRRVIRALGSLGVW